jgi:YD repeat-containing protein
MKSRFRFAATIAALALAASPMPSFADIAYVYDSAGRLIKVTYSNGVSIEYRYDASGNRQVITTAQAPNQGPVAVANSATVVASGTVDISVLANDSDPDGDTLTISAVSTPTAGTATILTGPARIRYVATATAGVRTFNYTISDGHGHTATATVTVTVTASNQPPVGNADTASTSPSTSTSIMVLANDTDPNNNTLSVTAVGSPTGGTVSIASGGGYVVYNAPAALGTYTFGYTVSDGAGGSASSTVTVYVESLEDPDPSYCEAKPWLCE